MGYCFGAAALELARSGKAEYIAGYVSFHGGLATPEDQAYPSETPPILIAHGGADTSVTMDEVVDLARQRRAPVSRMKFRSILARRMASPSSAPSGTKSAPMNNLGTPSPSSWPRTWLTRHRSPRRSAWGQKRLSPER